MIELDDHSGLGWQVYFFALGGQHVPATCQGANGQAFERTTIRAALSGSAALAQLAMLENPIIGQWELAGRLMAAMKAADPEHLGYLK